MVMHNTYPDIVEKEVWKVLACPASRGYNDTDGLTAGWSNGNPAYSSADYGINYFAAYPNSSGLPSYDGNKQQSLMNLKNPSRKIIAGESNGCVFSGNGWVSGSSFSLMYRHQKRANMLMGDGSVYTLEYRGTDIAFLQNGID
jgi:prepilin-type processing-associated H-X9-DG protein